MLTRNTTKEQYKYKDLMPLSEDERQRWLECHRAFVMGSILGVVKFEYDEEVGEVMYNFEHHESDGRTVVFDLGTEARSVVYMYESKSERGIQHMVLKEVEKRKRQLNELNDIASLIAVLRYYQAKIYPLDSVAVGGGYSNTIGSLQHSIIEEELQSMVSLACDLGVSSNELGDRARELYEKLVSGNTPRNLVRVSHSGRLSLVN
jgi:hypothetical protein